MTVDMDWEHLARANTHPLRVSILEVINLDGGRTLSPKDLSVELKASLGNINYHVTELVKAGLLEMASERQVRGAIEHFYRRAQSSNGTSASRNGTSASRSPRAKKAKKPKSKSRK